MGLSRKSVLFALPALIALLAPVPSLAQNKVLPASFGSWSTDTTHNPRAIPNINGGYLTLFEFQLDSNALKEYGSSSTEDAQYFHSADSVGVVLREMKDPSGAYGEFTFLRNETARAEPLKLGDNAFISDDRALIQYGNFVLDVRGDGVKAAAPELNALVAAIAPRADHGPLPTLPRRLPEKGRVEHSDLYVLGPKVLGDSLPALPSDWLGFSDDAEAELARYRVHGDEFSLVLADYPTPQVASRKLKELEEKYNANAASPKAGLPQIFATRQLTTLAIAVGARNKAEADVLLNQIQTDAQVTWNEPSFSVTEPSMVAMVVGAFIGTGIICVFAMISSLAFGGARLLIKRALPGKVFDRSSEVQILQLGLSSKPINAEDFYSLGGSSGK